MSREMCILFFLVGLGFLSIFGCEMSPVDGTVSVAIEGDAVMKAELESLLKSNPVVIKVPSGIEYSLKIVEPDPRIDYKMVIIEPDDDIGYSIIIVDPETREKISDLNPEIGYGLSKLLEQKKEPQKK